MTWWGWLLVSLAAWLLVSLLIGLILGPLLHRLGDPHYPPWVTPGKHR